MNLTLAYRGRSAIVSGRAGLAVSLAPNLRRDRVGFDGTLRHPVRFREAIGALHDVVVSDLRFMPRDKSAYEAYAAEQKKAARPSSARPWSSRRGRRSSKRCRNSPTPSPKASIAASGRCARSTGTPAQKYANHLSKHDPELWRLLMPCDPVITVAPDVLFFECFSADESSYGCLTVDRDAFAAERDVALGTTNVDYSWTLYEHFQKLRSYRETRFPIDPAGFEVQTGRGDGLPRGEDRPAAALAARVHADAGGDEPAEPPGAGQPRGPVQRPGLPEAAPGGAEPAGGPLRAEPGRPVAIVLEPWERRIVLHGTPYDGPRSETIRTWGRDRLRVLARLLPLLDGAEVYLLGTGLPSFWSIRMGEMRLLLGLSGWTANDWTGAVRARPDRPPGRAERGPPRATSPRPSGAKPAQTFEEVRARTGAAAPFVAAGLNRLASLGQLIHDLHAGLYRWRQIMPVALSLDQIGPETPETVAARTLVAERKVHLTRDDRRPDGLRILEGNVPERPVSLLLDADGRMLRGKCTCSHHFSGGLRKGPCRHLQALRTEASGVTNPTSLQGWYDALRM